MDLFCRSGAVEASQMAAGLGIAAAGWAVKRIWETIAKRKAEEEERIARHKDEVFRFG